MPESASHPIPPARTLSGPARDRRIRASLAQRCGELEDSLGETGHAPDAIDTTGIGHCRVVVPDAWVPTKPS